MSQPTPLLRNRDFQLLMVGRTGALIGASMTGLALMLLTYSLKGNAATASLVMSANMVGTVLATLPAGVVADRRNRRKVMTSSAIVTASLLASVPIAARFDALTIWQLGIVAFLTGMSSAFYGPAETASLKRVVSNEQLAQALGINQVRQAVAGIVGAPLAGALYGLSRTFPLIGDAVANAIAAGCASLVRTDLQPQRDLSQSSPPLHDAAEALGWLWRHRVLRAVLALVCLMNFGGSELMTALLLGFQQRQVPPPVIGLVETVLGVSALVGSAASAYVLRRVAVGHLLIVTNAMSLVLLTPLLWLRTPLPILLLLGVFGLIIPVVSIGLMTYTMLEVPDAMQGRINSAIGLVGLGLIPLGSMTAGLLLQNISYPAALLPGLVAFALCLIATLLMSALRTLPKPGVGAAS